jgi:hypothetical protein
MCRLGFPASTGRREQITFHNPITLTTQNLNMKKPGFDRAAELLYSKLNNLIQA